MHGCSSWRTTKEGTSWPQVKSHGHSLQCIERRFQRLLQMTGWNEEDLNINACSLGHRDRHYEPSSWNYVLQVARPEQGGGLWVELCQGDEVEGALSVRLGFRVRV